MVVEMIKTKEEDGCLIETVRTQKVLGNVDMRDGENKHHY